MKRQNNNTINIHTLKRCIIFLLMTIMVTVLPIEGTGIESNVISVKAASVKINQTKKTMWVGDTLKLKLINNKKKVQWTSNKKSVATVSSKGIVKAKKSGKAVITAKVKSKRYKCTVTVRKTTISASRMSLTEGDSAAISLKYPKKKVAWTTSNASVAYVSGEKVFAVAAGNAVVTAKCNGESYSCKVEVLPKENTTETPKENTTEAPKADEPAASLSASSITMRYMSSAPLTLNNPKGEVTWTTTDDNVAHVNKYAGVVDSKFVGEAVVTAHCNGVSYSCTVTVISGETEQLEESGIYTSKDKVALYIHTYHKLPSNFTPKQVGDMSVLNSTSLMARRGKCIGGDRYFNYEGLLPKVEGREYYECDINALGARTRGTERLVYTKDGLVYYTPDHYNTFVLLYE